MRRIHIKKNEIIEILHNKKLIARMSIISNNVDELELLMEIKDKTMGADFRTGITSDRIDSECH